MKRGDRGAWFAVALLMTAAATAACPGDGPGGPRVGPPARVGATSGAEQTGAAGAALPAPVVVRVEDAGGLPVSGAVVTFAPASGSGSVEPPSATTGSAGTASAVWTLGTGVGAQSLAVNVGGAPQLIVAATAVAGPVAHVELDRDSVRFAALHDTVTVAAQLADVHGNAASGTVNWTTAAPGVATVDAAGRITATGNGLTWIRAVSGAAADSLRVHVEQVPAGVSLSPGAAVLALGATLSLAPVIVDAGGSVIAGAPAGEMRYQSLQNDVASVNAATGVVTGQAAGLATIRVFDAANPLLADTARIAVAGPNSIVATAIVPGSGGNASFSAGHTVSLPIVLDVSRASANGDLGAAELIVRFEPSVLGVDSARVINGAIGNQISVGEYAIAFAGLDPIGTGAPVMATLFLKVTSGAAAGADARLELGVSYAPLNTAFDAFSMPLMLPGRIRVR